SVSPWREHVGLLSLLVFSYLQVKTIQSKASLLFLYLSFWFASYQKSLVSSLKISIDHGLLCGNEVGRACCTVLTVCGVGGA
ncbi:unnamed protein product, partial [Brassica oleracea var. botrytis]